MSFHLSSGTLDSMAGIFSPAKKYQPGSGGGKGRAPKGGAAMLGVAVASIFPKANSNRGAYRLPAQTKQAFGGGNQAASSGRAIAIMERTARRVPEVMAAGTSLPTSPISAGSAKARTRKWVSTPVTKR